MVYIVYVYGRDSGKPQQRVGNDTKRGVVYSLSHHPVTSQPIARLGLVIDIFGDNNGLQHPSGKHGHMTGMLKAVNTIDAIHERV